MSMQSFRFIRLEDKKLIFGGEGGGGVGEKSSPWETNEHEKAHEEWGQISLCEVFQQKFYNELREFFYAIFSSQSISCFLGILPTILGFSTIKKSL